MCALSLILLLTGCPGPVDTGVRGQPFLGADPTIPAAPGEARAGVIRDEPGSGDALFGGISAEGRAGDVKIYNSEVQFIIQGAYESHGYVPVGGGVIDADLVRPEEQLGRDLVEDVYLAFSMSRLFHAETVEVIADGSDGGEAIVRATGTDVDWGWFQGMFERDDPVVEAMGLEIATTFTMPPDSPTLHISTAITNPGDDAIEIAPQEGAWVSGEDLLPWQPGSGYDEWDADTRQVLIMAGRQGESTIALWPDQGEYGTGVITSLASEYGMLLAELGTTELGPGETVVLDRNLTIAPDPTTALAAKRAVEGDPLSELCGTVTAPAGPVAGARVHLVAGSETPSVDGWALTDEDGAFCSQLAPGPYTAYAVGHGDLEHVQLVDGRGRYAPFGHSDINAQVLWTMSGHRDAEAPPWAQGYPSSDGVSVDLADGGTESVDLELGAPGRLELTLVDQHGDALPGVLELLWTDGAPPNSAIPADLHDALELPTGRRAGWAWTPDGTFTIDVLPGTYDLEATAGWRHEQASAEAVEVLPGEATTLELELERVIDHEGWLAMDAHTHGAPSFDGALPMADRLVACAATGVDIAPITDHDVHVDYAPLLEAMGLGSRLLTFPAVEVTTMIRGHFNLWPIEVGARTEPNGGALDWWNLRVSTDELFEAMRDAAGPDALLQVNHPRTPGMLTFADFDPVTGEADDPDTFSWGFDTFELINGGVDDLEDVRADFFGFLDHGEIRTPLGVSDSHYRFIPCGMARTDVFLDRDSPEGLEADAVVEAVLAGHVVAATGVTLRAWAGGALPGDTLTGSSANVDVQVMAPSWIQPDSLRLIRDGDIVEEHALGPAEDGVLFDDSLLLEADSDAWFVLEVTGSTPMGDVWRNQSPYAMSNAFFLDVDGDGWQAPGP